MDSSVGKKEKQSFLSLEEIPTSTLLCSKILLLLVSLRAVRS